MSGLKRYYNEIWRIIFFVLLIYSIPCWQNMAGISYSNNSNSLIGSPILFSPLDGSTSQGTNLELRWNSVVGAKSYDLLIADDKDFNNIIINKNGIESNHYNLENLKTSTTYYWKVRADSNSMKGEWSSVWSFITYSKYPDAPFVIYPRDNVKDVPLNLNITWEPVVDCENYELFLSTDSSFSNIVTHTVTNWLYFSIDSLKDSSRYYFRIRAIKGSDVGSYTTLSFITENRYDLSIGIISPKNGDNLLYYYIGLTWTDVKNATHYEVEVASDSSFYKTVYRNTRVLNHYITIEKLVPDNYYWHVRALKNEKYGEWSETIKFKTSFKIAGTVLRLPYSFSERVPKNTLFYWDEIDFNPNYEIQFSRSENFESIDTSCIVTSNRFYVSAINLQYAVKYYWRVRGTLGNEVGPWSYSYSFTTLGRLPDIITLLTPRTGESYYKYYKTPNHNFSWKREPYSEYYVIQFASDSNFQNILHQQSKITDTTVFIYDMRPDYKYWRVRGENEWGGGTWSKFSMFCFTLPVENIDELPANCRLLQNYPNPFNPSTKIKYSVAEKCKVSLVVFDINGKTIKRLVDRIVEQGNYEVDWKPENISSGVYYYQIQAGNYNEIRKLVFLK